MIFDGTNGPDTLTGTSGDDVFNPLLGNDTVDGGDGFDVLNVDYASAVPGSSPTRSEVYAVGLGYAGFLQDSSGLNLTFFRDIEAINFRGDAGDNILSVIASPTVVGGALNLDGGAGRDQLILDVSAFASSSFIVGAAGSVTSNRGTFSNWESYDISLGTGVNTVTTGAGDDTIRSTGIDTVNGGAGNDSWVGNYIAMPGSLTFDFSGTSGRLSNGTTLTGIENVTLFANSVEVDIRSSTGYPSRYHVVSTSDTLTVSNAGPAGSVTFGTILWNSSGFGGSVSSSDPSGTPSATTSFGAIAVLNLATGAGNDSVSIDAPGTGSTNSVVINACAGYDILQLRLTFAPGASFSVDSHNVGHTQSGTFSNFESYWVYASDGGNTISTGAGDDFLYGGSGSDILSGGAGSDVLIGAGSADRILGLTNGDSLFGGAGDDTLSGGLGNDTLNGGSGNDTVTYADALGGVSVDLDIDGRQNTGSEGRDLLISIENLTGSNFDDRLSGDCGNNRLVGGEGNDVLSGRSGNDVLIGGGGADILTGGSGADTFVFDSLTVSADRDIITDFTSRVDHIALSRSVFAAFANDPLGGLSRSEFVIGTQATTANQHIIYNAQTGALYYDADGVGGEAQVQIAMLRDHPHLTLADFQLIG